MRVEAPGNDVDLSVYTLKRQGRTLYGFGVWRLDTNTIRCSTAGQPGLVC